MIVKSHQTCIYSKKNKNKIRLYVGLTGIDELVFVFFDFFEYMQVLCTASSQNHAFLASHAGFGEVQVTKPAEGMPF